MSPIDSYQEILQDMFYIKVLLDIKRKTQNIEAKNYLVEFIKDLSSVIFYENAKFLNEKKLLSMEQAFKPNMKKVVRERRQWLHSHIYGSKSITHKVNNMGIDYSQKIYDLNVIVKRNKLLSTNFENFNDRYELTYVDEILNDIEIIIFALLQGLGLDDDAIEILYSKCSETVQNIAEDCDKKFSGKRYCYSTYKLFSLNSQLTDDDKNFILQRYRLISSILKMEKIFANENLEIHISPMRINIKNFFRKYKAIIIEIIGEDAKKPQSKYMGNLCETLNQTITDKLFFPINRALRDNCHYSNITILSENNLACLDKYQNIYLNAVLQSFDENLYIIIDEDDIVMTNFFTYCLKNKIPQNTIKEYFPIMFNEYAITHKINKSNYTW